MGEPARKLEPRAHDEVLREAVEKIRRLRDERLIRERDKKGKHLQRNIWASQIPGPNFGCWREQYYAITEPDARPKPDAALLARFEEGDRIEDDVMADLYRILQKSGIRVKGGQERFELRDDEGVYLSGKMDALLVVPGLDFDVPFDVKNFHPNIHNRIRTFRDAMEFRWTSKAARQLLVYMHAKAAPIGMLFFCSLGDWKFLIARADDWKEELEQAEQLARDTMRRVRLRGTDAEDPPPFHPDPRECRQCWAFKKLCTPSVDFGPGANVIDDPVLAEDITRERELQPLAEEYKGLKKANRARLEGKEQALVAGQLLVQGRWRSSGSYWYTPPANKAKVEALQEKRAKNDWWEVTKVVELEQEESTESVALG